MPPSWPSSPATVAPIRPPAGSAASANGPATATAISAPTPCPARRAATTTGASGRPSTTTQAAIATPHLPPRAAISRTPTATPARTSTQAPRPARSPQGGAPGGATTGEQADGAFTAAPASSASARCPPATSRHGATVGHAAIDFGSMARRGLMGLWGATAPGGSAWAVISGATTGPRPSGATHAAPRAHAFSLGGARPVPRRHSTPEHGWRAVRGGRFLRLQGARSTPRPGASRRVQGKHEREARHDGARVMAGAKGAAHRTRAMHGRYTRVATAAQGDDPSHFADRVARLF